MKLTWSQAGNGNWNGKAGPYTLVTVDYHDAAVMSGWWVHPKLPGLKGQRTLDEITGRVAGDRIFQEWLMEAGIIG